MAAAPANGSERVGTVPTPRRTGDTLPALPFVSSVLTGGAALPVRRGVPKILKLGLKTHFIIMTHVLHNEMGEKLFTLLLTSR